ncbi:MAG: hypothetical protein ABL882_11115 [Sphingopyxis sp.]
MKKYAILYAVNVLIFGALSLNAWMTIAASDAAGPITWALAVLPLVILAAVALWLAPRAVAAMKSGKVERAAAKQERAEAHVAQAAVDDSAASRLRRVVQAAEAGVEAEAESDSEDAPEGEGEVEIEVEQEVEAHDEPAFDDTPVPGQPVPEQCASEPAPEGSWGWLMTDDGAGRLRLATDTGFPWVAAGIAEMASAVIASCPEAEICPYRSEAEAWLTIASDLPPAQPIVGEDAQGFTDWVNDLVVHSQMAQSGVAMAMLVDSALTALSARANGDAALAAALPVHIHDLNDVTF